MTPAPGLLQRLVRAARTPFDPDDPGEFDPDLIRGLVPWFDTVFNTWYRLEAEGLARVPDGPALFVINHESGITFLELFGWGAHYYRARGYGDPVYGLGHDAMFRIPGVGGLLSRMGGVRASHANADEVFRRGHKIVVAPGGNLEAFRSFGERARIKFGGHDGFVRLALRHGVPIVPVVFSGGHESFLVLSDGAAVVRALGLRERMRVDTWPLMLALPWGLAFGPVFHLPLPTKVHVRVLDPIATAGRGDAGDREAVGALYREVTGRMQAALTELHARRKWPVLG
jgi:1-acyl-sn-glycerol-3-phosphate acyltransferase